MAFTFAIDAYIYTKILWCIFSTSEEYCSHSQKPKEPQRHVGLV